MKTKFNLTPGKHYLVKIKGTPRAVRRIFKWTETRFGEIPYLVFTSRVFPDTQAEVSGDNFVLRGRQLPASQLSVPEYDLQSVCEAPAVADTTYTPAVRTLDPIRP